MEDTAKARYAALQPAREPFLRRARRCAEQTIPALLPPQGHSPTADLPNPGSSLGARGVTHLANKLMMAMYPPGRKSFLLTVPPSVLAESPDGTLPPDMENALAKLEDTLAEKIEQIRWRSHTGVMMQHLLIAGNAVEQMLDDGRLKLFRLDQFVLVRDPSGEPIELVIHEQMYRASLPEDLLQLLRDSDPVEKPQTESTKVDLYTWAVRQNDGTWKIHQELNDIVVPGSEGIYEISPFNVATWHLVVGEDYARSYVDDLLDDLIAHNELQQALLDGAAMASRNITMVRPNASGGLNLKRRLDRARNGETIVGNPEDVAMLRYDNVNGLQVTEASSDRLRRDLGAAFLLNSAMTRDAERVTAYELRKLAEELEGALGGVYSSLADSVQLARIRRLMFLMKKHKEFPDVPDELLQPVVMTGLEALGREQDVVKVQTAIQLTQAVPPDAQVYIDWKSLLTKAFNGLDLPDSVRTEEEASQIRQQQMAASVGVDVASNAAKTMMSQ